MTREPERQAAEQGAVIADARQISGFKRQVVIGLAHHDKIWTGKLKIQLVRVCGGIILSRAR